MNTQCTKTPVLKVGQRVEATTNFWDESGIAIVVDAGTQGVVTGPGRPWRGRPTYRVQFVHGPEITVLAVRAIP
jgi:hypothetical protein